LGGPALDSASSFSAALSAVPIEIPQLVLEGIAPASNWATLDWACWYKDHYEGFFSNASLYIGCVTGFGPNWQTFIS
jgi:hypothetical protein